MEQSMTGRIKAFLADPSGATAIEYAFLAMLIALAIGTSVAAVGTKLSGVFTEVSTNLK